MARSRKQQMDAFRRAQQTVQRMNTDAKDRAACQDADTADDREESTDG